jgi:hypothetical protein|nr:tetratricopeptide repeat protein [Kofleriaceae bacterium]
MTDDRDDMRDDELSELAKQLPWDKPDAARREGVRSTLLLAAKDDDARAAGTAWWKVGAGFAAGVAAAAAALFVVWGGGAKPAAPEATPVAMATPHAASLALIEASSAANFEREVTTSSGGRVDEVVHLHGGKLRLAVGTPAAGEHVRVQAGTSTVEGAGDYEVAVAGDALQAVTVTSGSVTVGVAGQQAVFLAAGQTWTAPVVAASVDVVPPVAPPQIVAPPPPVIAAAPERIAATREQAPSEPVHPVQPVQPEQPAQPAPPAPPPVASPEQVADAKAAAHAAVEHRFQAGYADLRAGRYDDAAAELAAAADAGDDALASDARYLEAEALVKAKRPGDAERALVAFLDRAPQSMRRARAEVMLARLIADRGDAASARKWFEAAQTDGDAEVAAAARAGLAALDRIH